VQKGKELAGMSELSVEDRKLAAIWVPERLKDEAWLTAARKYLTEHGYPADKVAKYPPEQVLFNKLQLRAKIFRDEALKWMNVPYWQAKDALADLEKEPGDLEEKLSRMTALAVPNVRAAHLRLEVRLALLRVVEAIRLEAARNGGKLPASLSEVSNPIPVDPATGKSFAYKVDGLTAIIEGESIPIGGFGRGAKGVKTTKYAYELRLRK
jgi:hypothetical protein